MAWCAEVSRLSLPFTLVCRTFTLSARFVVLHASTRCSVVCCQHKFMVCALIFTRAWECDDICSFFELDRQFVQNSNTENCVSQLTRSSVASYELVYRVEKEGTEKRWFTLPSSKIGSLTSPCFFTVFVFVYNHRAVFLAQNEVHVFSTCSGKTLL